MASYHQAIIPSSYLALSAPKAMDCAAACIKGDNIAAHFHIMAHSFKIDIISQIFRQAL